MENVTALKPRSQRGGLIKMPVVLHVGDAPTAQGGISAVIRGHLRRRLAGFSSTAVSPHNPDRSDLPQRVQDFWRAKREMNSLLREAKVDVIHVHLSQGLSLFREGYFIARARKKRIPVVVTIHGSGSLTLRGYWRRIYVMLLHHVEIVHGFGEAYREQFEIPRTKWRKLPNDVDVPGNMPEKSGPPRFVFVGAVGERKGVDLLLSAWALVSSARPDAVLTIAGPDTSDGRFPSQIASRANVEYLGPVSNEEALSLMSSAHTLVQPSRAEAFPVSVCEALSRSCAVVGTDVGALGELLIDSGQIVVEPEAASISAGMLGSLNRDLRQAGFRFARENLASHNVSAQWIDLYADAMGGAHEMA